MVATASLCQQSGGHRFEPHWRVNLAAIGSESTCCPGEVMTEATEFMGERRKKRRKQSPKAKACAAILRRKTWWEPFCILQAMPVSLSQVKLSWWTAARTSSDPRK